MSRKLNIGLAHIAIDSDITLQYQKICDYVDKAKIQGIDIICFPEMSLGYGANDGDKGSVLGYQANIAKLSYGVQMVYSSVRYDEGKKYISCFICEDGKVENYDKIYLGEKEKKTFTAGKEARVFANSKTGTKFSTFICYDMHFPQLCQKTSLNDASIVFVPHLMPRGNAQHRLELWKKYMCARAYDNRVYIAAVNGMVSGVGGGAGIWDMDGYLVASNVENKERILSYNIDLDELDSYRTDSSGMKKRFFLKDLKEI